MTSEWRRRDKEKIREFSRGEKREGETHSSQAKGGHPRRKEVTQTNAGHEHNLAMVIVHQILTIKI